jgi:structure-specific endonuclease subunit SLX1
MTIAEDLYLRSAPSQHFRAPSIDKPQKSAYHGIASMPVTYAPHKSYVEKAKLIIDFEQEGKCGVCDEELDHGEGIYTVCPNPACNSVSHLSCLSKTFLDEESTEEQGWESGGDDGLEELIPISGTCKDCGQTVKWLDVVKEVTLRTRGPKEIEKLLKNPRRNAEMKRRRNEDAKTTAEESEVEESDDLADDDNEEDGKEDLDIIKDDTRSLVHADNDDQWCTIDDSDDDMSSMASTNSVYASPDRASYWGRKELRTVLEDKDWDDAMVLD